MAFLSQQSFYSPFMGGETEARGKLRNLLKVLELVSGTAGALCDF